MGSKRKTVTVEHLRERANGYLIHSGDDRECERRGVCMLIEDVLRTTANYDGYTFLDTAWPEDRRADRDGRWITDDTRRHYF